VVLRTEGITDLESGNLRRREGQRRSIRRRAAGTAGCPGAGQARDQSVEDGRYVSIKIGTMNARMISHGRVNILDGIAHAPGAIAGRYRGKNLGKRLIRLN
jgi:hypothetical protein